MDNATLVNLAYSTLKEGVGEVLAIAHNEFGPNTFVLFSEGDVWRGYGVRCPVTHAILRKPFFLSKADLIDWLDHLEIIAIITPDYQKGHRS